MNFETKYLVRWGVPGWVMIICTIIYFYLSESRAFFDLIDSGTAPNILASGALLIIIGIPVGYILNQVHHCITWVLTHNWNKYFLKEFYLNDIFYKSSSGNLIQERYRYLLTRIHELGSICLALLLNIIIVWFGEMNKPLLCYLIVLIILFFLILLNRIYFARNLKKFEEHYLQLDKNRAS